MWQGAIKKAEDIKASLGENAYMLQQFNNPDNVKIHVETTGPEIWEQTDGKVAISKVVMYCKIWERTDSEVYAARFQPSDEAEDGSAVCGWRCVGWRCMEWRCMGWRCMWWRCMGWRCMEWRGCVVRGVCVCADVYGGGREREIRCVVVACLRGKGSRQSISARVEA